MVDRDTLTLPQAQEEFQSIARRMKNPHNIRKLIEWINWNWREECAGDEKPEEVLKSIAADIRVYVPVDAVLPSEKIRPLSSEEGTDQAHIRHLDGFLFDDELVSQLEEHGQIDLHYCVDCGSNRVKPMTLMSHSTTREQLNYLFNSLLPPIEGKTLLDVGSRLGAVLYGAYLYTQAAKVIGVEMNGQLCRIQREIIMKYGFQDRMEVVEDMIERRTDLLVAADVVVLHNVFEFFLEPSDQVAIWQLLRATLRSGTLLVTNPALDVALSKLPVAINVDEWVEAMQPFNSDVPGIDSDDPQVSMVRHEMLIKSVNGHKPQTAFESFIINAMRARDTTRTESFGIDTQMLTLLISISTRTS